LPIGAPARVDDRKAGATGRQQRSDEQKPLRKELTGIDNRLGVLVSDRDKVEAALAAAGVTPAQRAEQGKRLKQLADEIEALEARWLELSTRLDALTGQPAG
jgi:ATP-binding cassette subfamily F protein 3